MVKETLAFTIIVAFALVLFPPLSDADFAHSDGGAYADQLDLGQPIIKLLHPNHPLSHALAVPVRAVLATLGVQKPGRIAARVVAGAGLAAIALLIASQAGRRRWTLGLLCAAAFVLSRGALVAAGTGEVLLPAYAATLGAAVIATRAPLPRAPLGALLVLALLLRQDSLLFLPGIVAVAARSLPAGARFRPLALLLASVGLITLALYVALWLPFREKVGLVPFLLGVGAEGPWSGTQGFGLEQLGHHAAGLSETLFARHDSRDALTVAGGSLFVLLLLGAALLQRGRAAAGGLLVALAVTIPVRFLFYAWFEPANPEWHLATVMLLAAAAARLTDGEPVAPLRLQILGTSLVGLAVAGMVALHAPSTLALRRSDLAGSAAHALDAGGPLATIFTLPQGRMATALEELGASARRLPENPVAAGAQVLQVVAKRNRPVLVLRDVFALDGAPEGIQHAREDGLLEGLARYPGAAPLRWRGRLFGVAIRMPAPSAAGSDESPASFR